MADGLVEFLALGVEVDEGYLFFGGDLFSGLGVAGEGVFGDAGGAFHGGEDDGGGFSFFDFGDDLVIVGDVGFEGDGTGFHIVVAEGEEDVIAGLEEGVDFVETMSGEGGGDGFAGLGVVGDGDVVLEKTGKQFRPAGVPGFLGLGHMVESPTR